MTVHRSAVYVNRIFSLSRMREADCLDGYPGGYLLSRQLVLDFLFDSVPSVNR